MKSPKVLIYGLCSILLLSAGHMSKDAYDKFKKNKELKSMKSEYCNFIEGKTIPRDLWAESNVQQFENTTHNYKLFHKLIRQERYNEALDALDDCIMGNIEYYQDWIDYSEDSNSFISPLTYGMIKNRVESHSEVLRKYIRSYWSVRKPLPSPAQSESVFTK